MSFQKSTNQQPAPGVAGEFASTNPRAANVSVPGGLVAGPNGLACGLFAWIDPATYSLVSNNGPGAPNGFVHNSTQALITQYLGETSLVLPAGFGVGDLFDEGDFFCVNNGSTTAIPGQKAFANNANGQASFAATGTVPTNGSGTASSIAAGTATVTGSIAIAPTQVGPGNLPGILTVTAGSGLVPGAILSGSGVATGTMITSQISGVTGGVGTYYVNYPQTVASTSITGTWGVLTVGGTVTGTFSVGDSINGTGGGGVTAGTYITALGTGSGGAGTYNVNLTQTVTSSTINAQGSTETVQFYCAWVAAPGEVTIITTRRGL